jgi:hypothetical protein
MTDRCRSKYRCVAHTSDGAALTTRQNTICTACIVDIQRRYDELPHLAAALKTMKGGSTKVDYESKVNASREPGTPLNLHVMALLDDIASVLRMVDGYQIRDLVMLPAREYLIWVREVEQLKELDGVDRALRVQRLHQRLTHMVGLAPVRDARAAPCPNCGENLLGQWGGTEVIDCQGCDLKMPKIDYEEWCLYLIEHSGKKRA